MRSRAFSVGRELLSWYLVYVFLSNRFRSYPLRWKTNYCGKLNHLAHSDRHERSKAEHGGAVARFCGRAEAVQFDAFHEGDSGRYAFAGEVVKRLHYLLAAPATDALGWARRRVLGEYSTA